MPAGRPTKYTPELIKAAWAYLDNYEAAGDVVPSVVGLALDIGISEETAYTWAKEEGKEEFSDILTRVKNSQQRFLLSGSLTGGYNPVIAKMMLSKHGWVEESKTTSFNVTIDSDDADL